MRRALFVFSVLCVAGACGPTPVTTTPDPSPVSESREIQQGQDIDRYLAAAHRFYDDSALEHYLQQLGLRLAAKCERPGLPWTFRVWDDPGVNAFAWPGGFVYVTRGLLVYLNSEAQLAAVLGHEIGHVAARHAGRARREMDSLGLVVHTTAGSVTGVYGDVEGIQALLLANSREAEQEADDLGLHYMSDAGYDPTEMLATMRIVEHAVGDSPLPTWLTTHPTWERRIEHITLERSSMRNSGTLVERDAYLAHVNGLAFGVDRRKGYFKQSRFIVPAQGYEVTFPDGWALGSDGAAIWGLSPARDAVVGLTVTDQPSADSAARTFFAKAAKPRGSPSHAPVNGLTAVSASFSWMPYWVKVRGAVSFIESRGTVYCVIGYTKNSRWSANREVVEGMQRTFEPVPDADVQEAQPLRLATVSLKGPMSLAALAKVRAAPIEPTELAGINQVPLDSVLPPGQVVKWVVVTSSR